ncbi:MAG: hypothetical protein JO190_08945 [Candidatus Eremiobacteraeota bacterium]|nr:hypothetical protein [Candidatus Eremiobacteraeota bacterium]
MNAFPRSAIAAAFLALGVAACSGYTSQNAPSAVPNVNPGLHPNALIVHPSKLALNGIGERYEKTFVVREAGYTGSFNTSETVGCMQAALLEPSVGTGPKTTFTLTGKKKTTTACTITFSDTKGHKANFKFTVA